MEAELGRSPGPVYYPMARAFGHGPTGKGPVFTLGARYYSSPRSERKTRAEDPVGPQYEIPSSLSKQVESHRTSHNAGKFNASERKTFESGPDRSPGPAAYDTRPKKVKEVRNADGQRSARFMGSALRFYPAPPADTAFPGPGQYRLKAATGGHHPTMDSPPVVAFSKAHLRDTKFVERSPGPIYTAAGSVGIQCSSDKRSAGKFGFGTSSRFPLTGSELVDHMMAVHRVKGGAMPSPPRIRRSILHDLERAAEE